MLTEADGVPLVVHTTPANVNDETRLPALLDAMPAVQGRRGRPRRKPGSIFGDRAYGTAAMIALVTVLGIFSFLAPRNGGTHGSGLGVLPLRRGADAGLLQPLPAAEDVLRAVRRTLPSLPRPGRLLPGRHEVEALRATVLKQPLRDGLTRESAVGPIAADAGDHEMGEGRINRPEEP